MSTRQIIVTGAGAAGMMAAGRAAELGASVLLLEKMERPGKKLLITGNARCNLTDIKDLDDFVAMFGPNGRFLYGAFKAFFREDLLAFLRRYGVETKTEPDGRIFPASDDARDVLKAFERYMADGGVQVKTGVPVTGVLVDNGRVTGVQTDTLSYPASAVVLATGGSSYPGTGATGDGFRMAAAIGHSIVKLRPALVPLAVVETKRARSMQGVSLANVRLTAFQCTADKTDPSMAPGVDVGRGIPGKRPRLPIIESRTGDVMLTHYGLSGPVTLLMSLAIVDALERGPVSVSIDLKPGLGTDELRRQLQSEFDLFGKRTFRNILRELLPEKLVEPFVEMSGVPGDEQGHEITAGERDRLVAMLKSLRFNIKSPLPMAEALVTAGGVSLKEIDPRTMESRLIRGLHFCGEVMDLDAETGGYNLQAAFSTGWVAGESAATKVI
ncbi:MAG: hypothetical protein A2147_08265 [Chloroflexi bacterium RBG_16_57_8]|nr:MAG: hypothetical protein A2147_08265 [Chloroflexi bacterium RBG_16_57_8]